MALSVEPASHELLEQGGKKFVQYTFHVLPLAAGEGVIAQPVATFSMRYSVARAMHYDAGSAASVSFPSNYVSAGTARRHAARKRTRRAAQRVARARRCARLSA